MATKETKEFNYKSRFQKVLTMCRCCNVLKPLRCPVMKIMLHSKSNNVALVIVPDPLTFIIFSCFRRPVKGWNSLFSKHFQTKDLDKIGILSIIRFEVA